MKAGPSRREVWSLAWPLILANTTAPLLGLSDTAILGNSGGAVELAAISLGALVFSFIYWGLGFLRMTTTGFIAQATAKGDELGVHAAFLRPLSIGALMGALFVTLRVPIAEGAWALLSAGPEEEELANAYFLARIWGAPATLASLATTGVLIGQGRSKALLLIQLVTNSLNIALDVAFVALLGWGAEGVGIGTAISEWVGALLSLSIVLRLLRPRLNRPLFQELLSKQRLRQTLNANSDVMIRTFAMIGAFAFFTDSGARLGAATLAANHILLQFVSFSAFFLDGFAHVAELLVGRAKGMRDLGAFDRAVRRTSEAALLCACLLALGLALLGPVAIGQLTSVREVRILASAQLLPAAAYVILSVIAFQLDGIFIGTTSTRHLRNAALVSSLGFLVASKVLLPIGQNTGLWWSFVIYVALRGITLGLLFIRLRKTLFLQHESRATLRRSTL